MCQPTNSRLDSAKKQRKVLSLENSLNDELLDSSRRTLPQQSVLAEELHYTEDDFDLEDVISLQQGQAEAKELDLESQSNLSEHVQEQGQIDDKFLKYKLSESSSEETQHVFLDISNQKQHKSEMGPYSRITQHSARPVEHNSNKADGMDIE